MDSFLHKLMCLSIITSAGFYIAGQFDDKDILGFGEGQKVGNLVATANTNNGVAYFIDTDGNPKTAEYIATTTANSRGEIQMSAQLFNNEQRTITRMPLKKWRDFADQFQRVKERLATNK